MDDYDYIRDLWKESGLAPPKILTADYNGTQFYTLDDSQSVYFFVPAKAIIGGKYQEDVEPYKQHRVFSCVQSKCQINEESDFLEYKLLAAPKVVSCTKVWNLRHKFIIQSILGK